MEFDSEKVIPINVFINKNLIIKLVKKRKISVLIKSKVLMKLKNIINFLTLYLCI